MKQEDVRELIHHELTARGIVGGPLDDFFLAKVRVFVESVTVPEKIAQAAFRLGMDSPCSHEFGRWFSAYVRNAVEPLLQ